jgi:hypothetical protein
MEEFSDDYKFWIDSEDVTKLIDAVEGRIEKVYIGCRPNLRLEVSHKMIKADFYIEPTFQAYLTFSTFYVHNIELNEEETQYILYLGGNNNELKIYIDGDEE